MNRFTIAAAVAATACIIGIPTVAALASDDSTNTRSPSHSRVDDRATVTHSSDGATRAPSAVPTARTSEPGDDRGTSSEPGDDRGTDAPGDDNSGPGNSGEDDSGPGNTGDDNSGTDGADDNGDHHGHGG